MTALDLHLNRLVIKPMVGVRSLEEYNKYGDIEVKKIFSYLPLFFVSVQLLYFYYTTLSFTFKRKTIIYRGDYVGYTLVLFVLSFPLGSFLFLF
ncbi:hypothetical protein BKK47_05385 [Rodentibacter mrazii]|uniref:Uncharacterized protein n=1 Tax=Rodentibacter mrazii TaxID=1908257 RepID=A0A1V3IGB4_9PAST|nr:hypothetical protein BKK47_05385 [Rodentibacter mrazii]